MHASRAQAAAVAALSFAVLAIIWKWMPGAVVTFIAVVVLVQALHRRRLPGRSAVASLLLDATAIAVAVYAIKPPLVAVLGPLASVVTMAPLVLAGLSATLVVTYSVGAISAAVLLVHLPGLPPWSTAEVAALTAVSVAIFLPYMARMLHAAARATAQRDEFEKSLKEREARYRGLVEGVPLGLYRTSTGGHVLEANPAFIKMLGYPDRETVTAINAAQLYCEIEDRARWIDALERDGEVRDFEVRMRRWDGTHIWVRDNAKAVRDAVGTVLHIEGTLEDITDQKRWLRYEQAVGVCSRALLTEGTEGAMRTALEVLLEATDVSAVFIERNVENPERGLCRRLVHVASRMGIQVDPEPRTPIPWTDMPGAFQRLSRGEPVTFPVDEPQGKQRQLYTGSAVKAELDLPIFVGREWAGLIGFSDADVERRWEREDIELLRTVAEMIGASWAREQQHERLEQLMRSKDEFVASVSHELRTPLTAVVGFAMELRDQRGGPAKTEHEELIDVIADEAQAVGHIIEDLLVAARAEIGGVAWKAGFVDLERTVEGILASIVSPFSRRIAVHGVGHAWADGLRVRQILRNLITNAVRYGGNNIKVLLDGGPTETIVEVRDDGSGISTPEAERIFDPYYRAHEQPGQPASVGLGLYVSRELARLMRGELTYRYAGGWSIFELRLPAAGGAEDDAGQGDDASESTRPARKLTGLRT